MSIADEIEKLQRLKEAGTLSDEEFQQAKRLLIQNPRSDSSPAPVTRHSDLIGMAANRYVSFQIKMAIAGLILAIIFLIVFIHLVATQGGRRIGSGPSERTLRIINQSLKK